MKMKLFTILAAMTVCAGALTACGSSKTESQPAAGTESTDATGSEAAAEPEKAIHVELIAKGFQHQFWQTVKMGAEDAAAEYGATTSFDGPATESDIADQITMLNASLAKNPTAICLAALDTESVTSQLEQAKASGIPVVGFDSGVPDAPEGTIAATAATDNREAAKIVADQFMANADFVAKLEAATEDAPVVIALFAQDVTSSSITLRTEGFIEHMKELAEEVHPGAVAVTGHSLYEEASENPAKVIIEVTVPATADTPTVKSAAQTFLSDDGLTAVFCSNEGTVTGFLAATNDGADLAEGGKYGDLIVAGFDAGSTLKNAVREGWFIGAVAQDPYQIGYQAVELAVKAASGEAVSDVDTGAVWYNAENIDEPDIAQLVYD